MPYRQNPIVTGEIYHVFNRSIAQQPIFLNTRDYQRSLDLIAFYLYSNPSLRFSHYNRLSLLEKENFLKNLKEIDSKQIDILSYCLMPNHVHFLLKQTGNKGITKFISNFQNSYAKYFNIKNKRTGAVFQAMFKAVRIETDEQLLHVMRYIHLNPITSYVLRNITELENYPWCSYFYYIKKGNSDLVNTQMIKEFFSSTKEFQKFISDQIDYQRQLEKIKHLLLEDL